MFRTALLSGLLLLTGLVFSGTALAGADPTMHQVYQAADAGRFSEAQGMMDQVLRDHPNSGKAHYVEAQLLAKQGRLARAAAELGTAERLAPGLPFAKPGAVQNLQRRIASARASTRQVPGSYGVQSRAGGGFPMGLLLVGFALIAALVFFVRAMSRRNVPAYGAGFGPGARMQPYGTGMVPPMGSAAGGIGSGIVGGLATGAALGAGMVAGEALVHHFTDGSSAQAEQILPSASSDWDATPDDMGGADFGISDSSSWDDSSGGSDWN